MNQITSRLEVQVTDFVASYNLKSKKKIILRLKLAREAELHISSHTHIRTCTR